jgi:Family of unknown function (DUF6491)
MATRMTRMATALVAATGLIALVLSGCSSTGAGKRASRDDEALRARTTGGTAIVNRFNLDSWSAPNDHTVILRTRDGTRFRAETMGPCLGLDFAQGVGFSNRGGLGQIDRFSSVVLNDGTRCPFQSFEQLVPPESKALDAYEKADEKPKSK